MTAPAAPGITSSCDPVVATSALAYSATALARVDLRPAARRRGSSSDSARGHGDRDRRLRTDLHLNARRRPPTERARTPAHQRRARTPPRRLRRRQTQIAAQSRADRRRDGDGVRQPARNDDEPVLPELDARAGEPRIRRRARRESGAVNAAATAARGIDAGRFGVDGRASCRRSSIVSAWTPVPIGIGSGQHGTDDDIARRASAARREPARRSGVGVAVRYAVRGTTGAADHRFADRAAGDEPRSLNRQRARRPRPRTPRVAGLTAAPA